MHLILLIHLHYTAWLFVHNLCTKSAVAVLVVELCDSIFRSLPNFNQPKVQCIHNSFAWLVTNHNKYMKATPILNSFHWLPVRHCCMFNMAMAVCEFLRSGHPSYFSPFLLPYSIYYNTRWGRLDRRILEVPQGCLSWHKAIKQFGLCFAFVAPTIWHDLPDNVHSDSSVASFRKKLRLYPFA